MNLGMLLCCCCPMVGPETGEARVLENDHVRVRVAPTKGGAVTQMIHKKSAHFSWISDKGTGIAGTGAFFTPTISLGTHTLDLAEIAMLTEISTEGPDTTLKMTASLDSLAPGLSVERTFR